MARIATPYLARRPRSTGSFVLQLSHNLDLPILPWVLRATCSASFSFFLSLSFFAFELFKKGVANMANVATWLN